MDEDRRVDIVYFESAADGEPPDPAAEDPAERILVWLGQPVKAWDILDDPGYEFLCKLRVMDVGRSQQNGHAVTLIHHRRVEVEACGVAAEVVPGNQVRQQVACIASVAKAARQVSWRPFVVCKVSEIGLAER
jgi:hypothetical protein